MRQIAPDCDFRFWGGDLMKAVAGEPVKHIRDLAFMGFAEVVMNIRTILSNIKLCKKDILNYQPDALILIDYPGFNLRMAEFAHAHNIKVHYYISPQVWAWKQKRVFKIKKVVDHLYCILPFEKEFYRQFNYEVDFVGHPLADAILNFKRNALDRNSFLARYNFPEKKIIALLPGSRKQEILKKLPVMLKAAEAFPDYLILIAGAPNITKEFYSQFQKENRIQLIQNDTYNLLNQSSLAMVTSGTATLETALFKVPEVVCYKGSPISYHIAKRLIKVKYISLVNLIRDKEIVKELIQFEMTETNIVSELKKIESESSEARKAMLAEFDLLEKQLGGGGASFKTAELILSRTK